VLVKPEDLAGDLDVVDDQEVTADAE